MALRLALGRHQEHGGRIGRVAAAERLDFGLTLEPEDARPGWRAIGASVPGTSHAVTMTRCQDVSAYRAVRVADGDFVVLAVADGAGSASASFHGATIAVESAMSQIVERLASTEAEIDDAAMRSIFAFARERVIEIAREYDHAVRDYASTLLVAVAGPAWTLAAQVGDGAVVVGEETSLYPLTWPQQGEYANATRFLIDDDALEHLAIARAGASRRVAMFSDGLQSLALQYSDRSAHAPFFEPFFAYLETSPKDHDEIEAELRAYLDSPALNARTDDDKSFVLAVRK